MTGKEKCNILKAIRNEIAILNGIDCVSRECDFEGECLGFCPECDGEVRFLENALMEKAKNGMEINLESLANTSLFDSCKFSTNQPVFIDIPHPEAAYMGIFADNNTPLLDDDELMGNIIPPDDPDWL